MQLKGVIIRAHNNGLIPRNPFANFHMRPNVVERAYLTEMELKELMTHKFDNDNLTFCRDVFVFASMTALLEAIVYRAIRSAHKKRELYEDETMKYIPVPRHKGCHAEVYNLDLILYLTYKIPSRNARIFRRYMTNKAYARNPYEHVCIIIDDVDFKAGIHTQME